MELYGNLLTIESITSLGIGDALRLIAPRDGGLTLRRISDHEVTIDLCLERGVDKTMLRIREFPRAE